MKWRRAMVVLASAGGNDVAAIARLVQTSPDRVREMIHRFNELGMRSLDPQWAGGRPRQITTTDRELIVKTAKTRPRKLGRPFTHWSIRKLADYLAIEEGPQGRHRPGAASPDPVAEGDHVPAHQDLEGVTRPAARRRSWPGSSGCWSTQRDRTFAFDEFGPLTISPVGGSALGAGGQAGAAAGELPQAARVPAALRLLLDRRRSALGQPRAGQGSARDAAGDPVDPGRASTTASRST